MENEIWKDIPIYLGLYEASNFGRIRSKEGKMTLSVRSNKKVKRVWKQRIIKQIRYRMHGKKEYAYSKDGRRYKIVPIDRKELNKRDA